MNRISHIVFNLLGGVLLLVNIVAIASLVINFDLKLESSLAWFNSETFSIALLAFLEIAAIIFFVSICSAFCILSSKKWLVIIGTITSLLVCGYASYLALYLSFGFFFLSILFLALSSFAFLLTIVSKKRLASFNNQPTTHSLFRPALFLTLTLLLLSAFWLLPDEPLDPNFHRFYTDNIKTIADSDNVAIGISGLDAPIDSNFMDVGLLAFKSAQIDMGAMLNKNKAAPTIPGPANKITFVGTSEELNCWIGLPETSEVTQKCASEKRLHEILESNAVLLSRYWQVAQLQHTQGIFRNGEVFLLINRLIAAEVQLKIRHGRYEDAYQEWRKNYQFINRLLSEDTDWLAKAIFSVAEMINESSAEVLIHSYTGIATLHGDELMTMLKTSGSSRWNLKGTLRSEYALWSQLVASHENQFWFHPNFIRNSWLHSSMVYIDAASLPKNMANESTRKILFEGGGFKSWGNDYLRDPLNTVLVRGILIGSHQNKSSELIRSMHMHDAKRIALVLALNIKRQDINDNQIADFLAAAEPALMNPFTNKPMNWNAKTRSIQYIYPKTGDWGEDTIIGVRL